MFEKKELNFKYFSLFDFCSKIETHKEKSYELLYYVFLNKIYLTNNILHMLGYNNSYFKKRQSVSSLLKNHKEIKYIKEKINNTTFYVLNFINFKKLCILTKNKITILKKINTCIIIIKTYKKYISKCNKQLKEHLIMITASQQIVNHTCKLLNTIIKFQNITNSNNTFFEYLMNSIQKLIYLLYSEHLANLNLLSEVSITRSRVAQSSGSDSEYSDIYSESFIKSSIES